MILKGLREKSNQKHINKLLKLRASTFSDAKIESLGVILNSSEFADFEAFRDLGSAFKINPNKIKIIAFTEDDKAVEGSRELLFSKKQIGWNAKIKHPELKAFIDTNFDALVCFYKHDLVDINVVAALSKAVFKIGLSGHDERQFDLIIGTESKNFEVFKSELNKYLNILNKIKK